MKRNVRLLPALGAVLLLSGSLLLSGCHGSRKSTEFDIPESFDTSKKIELTFWAKNDTNKNQTKVYENAITDFQKIYPNITVNMRLYTDYGKIYDDVITNIATQTTPNVCITYPDHIATYLTGSNVVVPLDELMADEQFGLGGSQVAFDAPTQAEIVPEFLSECVIGDQTYALPYMRSTEACYVNRTFVEALGYELPEVLTWDFVWAVSEAATKKNEEGLFELNGQKVMIPFIYKSTDNMMICMLKQQDAGYSTDQGQVLLFNDTTKELLQTIADHAGTGAFSTFKISGYPANFLNAGQCIFAVDSTAGATWMGSHAPLSDISPDKFVEFETAVFPIPQFDAENPAMISQGPSVCIFNKEDPQVVLASWLFSQYLLSNDVQVGYARTEGYVPVTTKAQESQEYLEYLSLAGTDYDEHYDVKIAASRLLVDNTSSTFVTPVFNGSTSLRNAAGQLVESVTKSVRRKEDIGGSYLDDLFSQVTNLYHLDQNDSAEGAGLGGKAQLGPLPAASKALIAMLLLAWCAMGVTLLIQRRKRKP